MKIKELNIDYDETADVLYISFGPPIHALSEDIESGQLIRYDFDSGECVGITLLDFKDRYIDGDTPYI